MARRASICAVAVAILLTVAGCGDAEEEVEESVDRTEENLEQATRLTATLTGPAETAPGDPDGTGTANVNVDVSKGEVCYDVSVQRLDQPVGMHIHEEGAGKNGPVVVPLNPPSSGDSSSAGCVEVDAPLIARILVNPDGFYVNVHTGPFPQGAVRGQLARA